ncbi:MAG: sigma-70 family RNA polymerase sigma factor [Eubacterium sp.]|jgi:RNA polymerase sigma factor (sigma-70 family)|nr:sigma-70 family RNA polymerase sigma factor [Eubacterium sp.]
MDFIEKIYTESEYYDSVRNTILYMMPGGINKFDLDDCISEVYKIALQKRNEVENHPLIQGWLVLTAKNVVKRYLRKKSIEKRMLLSMNAIITEPVDNYYECEKSYDEFLDFLRKSLKRSDYKLFTMKFVEKRSTTEIAEYIRIKPHSADSRITRLKNKIKKILEET